MARKETIKTKKMDPERYAEILKNVNLDEIYLQSCSMDFRKENLAPDGGLEVVIKDKPSYSVEGSEFRVRHSYTVIVRPSDGEKKKYVIKISVDFAIHYRTESAIGDDFFEVFRKSSLMMNTWPYLREFTQNMIQRTGLPPLVLPLYRQR